MMTASDLMLTVNPTDSLVTVPENDPYDYGLRIENGDLVFAHNADGLRDLSTVHGTENLTHGLLITLGTPLGSDMFNVLFGFDLYSILRGGYSLTMTKQLIRLHVIRTISTEDRILRIEELVFDDDARYAELNPDFDISGARRIHKVERRWNLDGVLQTTEGDVIVLPVELSDV